jgi:putative solute:sodium symporter small subunit
MAPPTRLQVNFFKPSTPGMKKEVGIASTILVIWALLSFGIPALIYLAGLGDSTGLGESFITHSRFLGFPLHYWLIAQGCTIGYILLCKLYCVLWDKRITRR